MKDRSQKQSPNIWSGCGKVDKDAEVRESSGRHSDLAVRSWWRWPPEVAEAAADR